jgi:hypothetical protein
MSLRDRFLAKLRDSFANKPLSLRLIFWTEKPSSSQPNRGSRSNSAHLGWRAFFSPATSRGWGGHLCWAAVRYGIEGSASVSDQQFAHGRERVAALRLTRQLEIRRQDYREVPGQAVYDKIVSGRHVRGCRDRQPAGLLWHDRACCGPAGLCSTTASPPPTATAAR